MTQAWPLRIFHGLGHRNRFLGMDMYVKPGQWDSYWDFSYSY